MPGPNPQGSTATADPPALQKGLTQFLNAKAKGNDSGNYRRNAKSVITRWIDWLAQRDIESFEQLDETVLAHYAERLRRRVAASEAETTDGGIARSTAGPTTIRSLPTSAGLPNGLPAREARANWSRSGVHARPIHFLEVPTAVLGIRSTDTDSRLRQQTRSQHYRREGS
jgi:hypothetical protein